MDSETGECVWGAEEGVWDAETGEMPSITQDIETGEYEDIYKRRFKIPSSYFIEKQARETANECKLRKADPSESQLITAIVFLLPAVIFFHPILHVLYIMLEIGLHNYFHKKNKSLEDYSVYFRSPLHGITKELCGRCKDENAKDQIAKMQDINHLKVKNYIKRVVT